MDRPGIRLQNFNNKTVSPWLLASLGAVLVFFVLSYPLISVGCLFRWDAWTATWPWFYHLAECVQQGNFPFWSPQPNCGFPFFAEPQTGCFYPIFLGAGFLFGGGYRVYLFLWLLHWLFAVLGILALSKRMGMSAPAGFVSAVLFGFSGFFTGNAQHVTMVITISYFPWILLLLDIALTEKIIYAPVAGVMLGFAALGGNPTMWVYLCVMLPAWSFLRYGFAKRVIAGLAIVVVVAVIIFSPSIVSFLFECKGYTDRTGTLSVTEACDNNRFPIMGLISMVSPALSISRSKMLSGVDASMSNGYIGIWGFLCLICAFVDREFRREYRWLLIFMAIAFLFSLGSIGGLRLLGYYSIPVLKYVRHTGVSRLFWMFGGCLIAGLFFDRLIRSGSASKMTPFFLPGVVTGLLTLGVLCWEALDARSDIAPPLYPRDVLVLQAILAVLLIVSFFMSTTTISRTALMGLVCILVVGDAALHVRSNRFTICNDKGVAAADMLENLAGSRDNSPMTGYEKRITLPGTSNRWVFDGNFYVKAYLATTSKAYEYLVGNTQFAPFENTEFLKVLGEGGRFWIVPTVDYAELNDARALSVIRSEDGKSPFPVYIHDPSIAPIKGQDAEVLPGSYGQVKILSYKPTEVTLAVDAPSNSWLFAAERYAASWQAFVDGKETPLYVANWVFRALPVPSGTHVVRMAYSPWLYKPFWAISWTVSVIILLSWMLGLCLRRRDSNPGAA